MLGDVTGWDGMGWDGMGWDGTRIFSSASGQNASKTDLVIEHMHTDRMLNFLDFKSL